MSGYLLGDEEAIVEVNEALESLGLDEDAFNSIAFLHSLSRLEDIEKLLTAVEVSPICGIAGA